MRREPSGSLQSDDWFTENHWGVNDQKVIDESAVNYREIIHRHKALNSQLVSCGMTVVDVQGDGNCLFRAVSLAINGDESHHAALRASVASYIEQHHNVLDGVTDISPDDGYSFSQHLAALRTDGTAVGEDVIFALTAVCQRDIYVYTAYAKPLTYHSNCTGKNAPIRVAFFEPGHYKAVIVDCPIFPQSTSDSKSSMQCGDPSKLNLESPPNNN
jgi:hypothetical protein